MIAINNVSFAYKDKTVINDLTLKINKGQHICLSGEVRAAISDLAVLKYEVLKKVGDAVGNTDRKSVV